MRKFTPGRGHRPGPELRGLLPEKGRDGGRRTLAAGVVVGRCGRDRRGRRLVRLVEEIRERRLLRRPALAAAALLLRLLAVAALLLRLARALALRLLARLALRALLLT